MELLINLAPTHAVHLLFTHRLRNGARFLGDHDTALSLFLLSLPPFSFNTKKKIHLSLKGDVLCSVTN